MFNDWISKKQKLEKKYGKLFSYDIVKHDDSFFLADLMQGEMESIPFDFIERIGFCLDEFLKKPAAENSILDLGCMEGAVGLALAKKGFGRILGVDGREAHIVKADFTRDLLGLKNCSFLQEDVRKLDFKPDSFDAVLALGILYHLDAPDAVKFIENIFKWTKEVTIIDTHISLHSKVGFQYQGGEYWGLNFFENDFDSSDSIENTPESSLGNKQSFWFTKPSLYNLLIKTGYTGIYECKYPRAGWRENDDRITVIATKKAFRPSGLLISDRVGRLEGFKEKKVGVMMTHTANRLE